ncbi:MarR family transcriptional regulator [Brucella sp. 10RB9215]|uniref:MarR family winged helix-turn-helix transcriptional regulator n=1 Tax=Brucella inopinata TaxID=1218315 RepID=A0AAW7B4X2_9HYPH|nr:MULTISPECIES: MarR family winged helix-turn-helix transcriptional regulator [Brucella]KEY04585.1 MarR family transcriptional regulator [Brucella suis bv. 4 str. 40]EEZ33978.1 transcriptional regulator [Brucella sp. 83/13]EFM55468.1 MarR family transcriptional regulator [Brucella inopinata BO1]EFM59612.1 MarR family transcriptional regulator [Brucella sp. BO2]EFM62124.1 MarR family transcriptional regulator [Brucella sp. NF 2653]
METKNHVLTDIDYQVLAEWRYRSRRFMSFSATAAEAEGLPPQQHQALLAIKASGPDKLMTVGTLAERLVVAPHTATELTGRLVAAGLVARVVDLADRRRHTLELTVEAEHILERLSPVHLAEIRELAPKFIDVLIKLNKMANEPE